MSAEKGAERRYWDSCVFIGYLKDEYNRRSQCLPIIKAAESDRTKIITSALTLAEVFWIEKRATPDSEVKRGLKIFLTTALLAFQILLGELRNMPAN